MFLLFLCSPLVVLACGPSQYLPVSCMNYGLISLVTGTEMITSSAHHLDSSNWTEDNFRYLSREISDRIVSQEETVSDPYEDPLQHFERLMNQLSLTKEDKNFLIGLRERIGTQSLTQEEHQRLLEEFESSSVLSRMPNLKFYLRGLVAFYREEYSEAAAHFTESAKGTHAALAEAASYLNARSLLLASQLQWDGYQIDPTDTKLFRPLVDQKLVNASAEAFKKFLLLFPNSRWKDSAQNLLARKLKRLEGDADGYWKNWGALMDRALAHPRQAGIINSGLIEVTHINPQNFVTLTSAHPLIWIIRSYYVTRRYSADQLKKERPEWEKVSLERELKALEKDRPRFAVAPEFFAWSKAILLLALGKGAEGSALMENDPVISKDQSTPSWIVLRARLLMNIGKFEHARALLRKAIILLAPAKEDRMRDLQLFYALTYYWEKKPAEVFSKDNFELLESEMFLKLSREGLKLTDYLPLLKKKLPEKLRPKIEEIALTKLMVNQKWQMVIDLWEHIKDEKVKKKFLPMKNSVKVKLSSDEDPVANYEIGKFLAHVEGRPEGYALCNKEKLQFPQVPVPIEWFIRSSQAFEKAGGQHPTEAKVLAALVGCFKDSYSAPYCFGTKDGKYLLNWEAKEIYPQPLRKKWFQRLKKIYPHTPEGKAQKTYW